MWVDLHALDRFYEIFTTENSQVGDYHKWQCRQMLDESLSECGISQLDRFCEIFTVKTGPWLFIDWYRLRPHHHFLCSTHIPD